MRKFTIEEVQNFLVDRLDVEDILYLFKISSRELVEAFPNKIVDNWAQIKEEFDVFDVPTEDEGTNWDVQSLSDEDSEDGQ